MSYTVNSIGSVKKNKDNIELIIKKEFRPALKELDQFSHLIVIWWISGNDNEKARSELQITEFPPFYGDNIPTMGIFATRAEYRPNPIAITSCQMLKVDFEKGRIYVPWFDAFDGTPIIDIKPYIMMSDVCENADYPPYLQHWPRSQEKASK